MCFVFANFSRLTSNFLQSSNFLVVYFPKTLNVRGVGFYCTLSTSYRRVLLIKHSYPISARIRSTEQILQHDASLFASVAWIIQSFFTLQVVRTSAIDFSTRSAGEGSSCTGYMAPVYIQTGHTC